MTAPTTSSPATVSLYWIPLGSGNPIVQLSGRTFEAIAARRQHRSPCDLYHAALEIRVADGRFMIEQAPVPDDDQRARGVVATGPVGFSWAGRFRVFRYEVRCWRDGVIPDLGAAVASPVPVSRAPETAARILRLLPEVPVLVWGRDPGAIGDMWNSNSVIAWTLRRSGVDVEGVEPPLDGRAPGWRAGLVVAERMVQGDGAPTPAPTLARH